MGKFLIQKGEHILFNKKDYYEGEKIELTDAQAAALGTAVIPLKDGNDEPTDKSTVPQIKDWLAKNKIEFDPSAKKEDLLKLIQETKAE